jgi:nitrogen fixation protein NifU and related proteins
MSLTGGDLHINGYHPQVAELFLHTPFAGEMEPGLGVFVGTAGSQSAGTEVRFWLKAGGGRIQAISFRAYGCPHTIAAAAWVAHHARGLALADVGQTSWLEVERALAVPPQKRGRLLIVEDALKSAVKAATRNV